jgi:peptide/nickel transport system ATP-binding protein
MEEKSPLLTLNALSVRYHTQAAFAVHPFHLQLSADESIGIVGESGSGKSSIAHAIMGLLFDKADVGGTISFNGKILTPLDWQTVRWRQIALVFQNASNVLNPMMKLSNQVAEPMVTHLKMSKREARQRAFQLLEDVGLDSMWWQAYPSQISGGMRQKVLIAMALACEPKLLIVDEPTMSLDPAAKIQIAQLIQNLQKKHHFGLIVISHEMRLIQAMCSKVYVFYRGHHLEFGPLKTVLESPKHPYTKGLIGASWELDAHRDIWGIPVALRHPEDSGCPFYERCFQAKPNCLQYNTEPLPIHRGHSVACQRGGIADLLKVRTLKKIFYVNHQTVTAVSDVSFDVKEGEVLAIIGTSGSGKSTLAHLIAGYETKDAGDIFFKGERTDPSTVARCFGGLQLVVQDPSTAMNGHWCVRDVIDEPLKWPLKICEKKRGHRIRHLLNDVQLPSHESFLMKQVHQLSGGEKQRLALARALAMAPKLLIADEITAMLDPSNAANIIKLLKEMQNRHGFSMIFITHDLYLARKIADSALVLERGKVIDYGPGQIVLETRQAMLNNALSSNAQRGTSPSDERSPKALSSIG